MNQKSRTTCWGVYLTKIKFREARDEEEELKAVVENFVFYFFLIQSSQEPVRFSFKQ